MLHERCLLLLCLHETTPAASNAGSPDDFGFFIALPLAIAGGVMRLLGQFPTKAQKAKRLESVVWKVCACCKCKKGIQNFRRIKKCKDGHANTCISCTRNKKESKFRGSHAPGLESFGVFVAEKTS